jgi:hypothetical protein
MELNAELLAKGYETVAEFMAFGQYRAGVKAYLAALPVDDGLDDLMACPFCGGKAEIHSNTSACSIKKYGDNRFWPVCTNVLCPASGQYRSNEKLAIKAWNTREQNP